MAVAFIAPDGDAIVSEIYIAAPPEDVFRALVDPEFVVKWWGGQGAEQSFRLYPLSIRFATGRRVAEQRSRRAGSSV